LKQNLIAGILESLPLKTSASIERWKTRAAKYPHELGVAVLRKHAQIDHFWRWQMWLNRGPNMMMFIKTMIQVEEKLLHMLLGLNSEYYFGFKWIDVVIRRMAIKPENFAQRFKELHMLPSYEGAESIIKLVDETYDLIEKHMPEINVKWLRNVFHYERPAWENQPPIINS